jgi:hypothetical protein
LEVGAEGGFKLDLRQDRDPGKQKLKGALRTETYRAPLLPTHPPKDIRPNYTNNRPK